MDEEAAYDELRCSRCVFGPREVIQPRYVVGGVSVCQGCALSCVPEGVAEAVVGRVPLEPFACDVAALAASGLCADLFKDGHAAPDASPAAGACEAALSRAAAQQDAAPSVDRGDALAQQLESCVRTRDVYEDAALLAEVRGYLPLGKFRVGAAARREAKAAAARGDDFKAALACAKAKMLLARSRGEAPGGYPSDGFLEELVNFFKGPKFFTWFKKPDCASCGNANKGKMHFKGTSTELSDWERAGWASRVELYGCGVCGAESRFARLNSPRVLLSESRTGRCGEFANAFTCCAVACGFEARYVLDTTDHVWSEVWSVEQGRWLHVDPCEKKIDKPLLYEKGWGKKLVGVFAFGRDEVLDVTRRYTRDLGACLARRRPGSPHWRGALTEAALGAHVSRLDANQREKRFGGDRPLAALWASGRATRQAAEARELRAAAWSAPGPLHEAENEGRTAGDAEWIRARGEDGAKEDPLPGGSWARSARGARVSPPDTTTGKRTLRAELRSVDGEWRERAVAFAYGDAFCNKDGTFEGDGADPLGALAAYKRGPARDLASLAEALRDDALNCCPAADVAECRRRHAKILANLVAGADPKHLKIKLDNAIIRRYVVAPAHAAAPWLFAAVGFDAADDGASLAAPPPSPDRARRALAAFDRAWPAP